MLDILTATRDEIERVQAANFARMMDLALERHAYYRALARTHGLGRADFATPADIAKLPLTTKDAYMRRPSDFVLDARGLDDEMRTVWDTMYTTGSTAGTPTPFVSSAYDFFRILELQRNMLRLRGVRADDRIANLFPLTRAPHGGWIRVLHAAASLNVPVVSALPGRPSGHFTLGNGTDEVIRIVERDRSTILWGVPSYLARVVSRAAELAADLSSVRLVFVTGEALGEAAREEIAAGLARVGARAQVSISYGATEYQGGMVECVPGSGYHNPAPDQILLDVVDPVSHSPVADGIEGLVVITHLDRTGTVLLRYGLGDTSVRTRERCPHCGSATDRLVARPRRVDALVKVKGMLVNPAVLVESIEAVLGARAFVAVIDKEGDVELAADVLLVRMADGDGATDAARAVMAAVKAATGVTPVVKAVPVGSIVDQGGAWKTKRFIDRRPGTGG